MYYICTTIFNNGFEKGNRMGAKRNSRKNTAKRGGHSFLWLLLLIVGGMMTAQVLKKNPELTEKLSKQVNLPEMPKMPELPKLKDLAEIKLPLNLLAEENKAPEVKTHKGKLAYEDLEIPKVVRGDRKGQLIQHKAYTLLYSTEMRTPIWVAWEVTREEIRGNSKRTNEFVPDPKVKGRKAYTADYTGSGYDRGHMAPAADMKWNQQAMEESFYMTNICPQVPNLNRGDWNDLEEKTREWAKRYGSAYVACGPIYRNKTPKRIGTHEVAVPDAFFKVILVKKGLEVETIGFIFENRKGAAPLKRYSRPVKEVERITGMDFFSALPDEIEKRTEANCNVLRKELK